MDENDDSTPFSSESPQMMDVSEDLLLPRMLSRRALVIYEIPKTCMPTLPELNVSWVVLVIESS